MVSILILAHNQLSYTRQCVDSILRNTSQIKTPFEILICDNASTDGTTQYLQGLEATGQIRVIYNKDNKGFPAGNNQLVAIAKGEYFCLLNNDTITSQEWLEKLLRCIRSDSKIAAVGPLTNHSSGYQQSPIPADYNGPGEFDKFAERYSLPDKEVDFLVFFCFLIKKQVWEEIGGLDEDFGLGNYDDNLFCWRVVEKGYKMKIAGNCFIHHYVSKTFMG